MSRDVVVVGTAVVDIIGYAERQPREGETIVGTRYEIAAGGKGLNQAVAAARAGAPTRLMAAIGPDDFGKRLSLVLEADGVDASAVSTRSGLPTGVGLPIVTETGENSIVVVPGASVAIGQDHHQWMNDSIDDGTVFVSQSELPHDVVAPVLARASARGALVVLNPAPAGEIRDMIEYVSVLVPNEHEAADLTGIESPELGAHELASWKRGLRVVVTCGRAGAFVVDGDRSHWIEAPRVDVVDTVGAGDVFCGYLAASLAAGGSLLEAAQTSVRAASISVGRRGAATSAPRREVVSD